MAGSRGTRAVLALTGAALPQSSCNSGHVFIAMHSSRLPLWFCIYSYEFDNQHDSKRDLFHSLSYNEVEVCHLNATLVS